MTAAAATTAIRIMIADDHPVVRAGIVRLLEEASDLSVTCEAEDGEALLRQVADAPADVLLLDVSMPGPGFLETMHQLRARRPGLPVLVLSVHPDSEYAHRALEAGARGYVCKDRSPEELADAIRTVHRGDLYRHAANGPTLPHDALSAREFQILCHIGSGIGVTEIATNLNLSPKTVSTYRSRLLAKLGLSNNADIMRYVIQHGLEA